MNYQDWQKTVPADITQDPLWKLDVYRLGLFVSDIAWKDALTLSRHSLTRDLADQLYQAVCSISANIAEGYSRSTAKTEHVSLSIPWARHVKHVIGIISLVIF